MLNKWVVCAALLAIAAVGVSQEAAVPADGEVRVSADGSFEAWDVRGAQWRSPEAFWEAYAARRGGLTWGRRASYPAYADVSELDTLIIELDSGPCLMEFFHERWRRANDVRRWADEFNAYGGCPHVFD